MIKIEQTSQPIIWQVNREHLLPATNGQVRWNGSTKHFEVCDNNNNGMWYKIDNTVELRSDPELADVMRWAKKKMQEDQRIEELAKQYPAVKDAKEKLDIIVKLVQDEQTG
jgi:hypothetical protein